MNPDNQWLKQHITNPSEDEIYFFVERVGIILDSYPVSTDFALEDARKQAFKELSCTEILDYSILMATELCDKLGISNE